LATPEFDQFCVAKPLPEVPGSTPTNEIVAARAEGAVKAKVSASTRAAHEMAVSFCSGMAGGITVRNLQRGLCASLG
jgi:hypothetical protein